MIINLTGVLGIAANILIYQQKSGKKLLIFKMLSDILWASHYFLLNANTAAAAAVVGLFREIVFYSLNKKGTESKFWLVFFLICSSVLSVFTWQSFYSILPSIAAVISVISFWRNNPHLSRCLAFPVSAAMLTYDIIFNSYMGIANEVLTLISAFAALAIYKKTKKTSISP